MKKMVSVLDKGDLVYLLHQKVPFKRLFSELLEFTVTVLIF